MTTEKPRTWYVGMDADTILRARRSDANLQGIINGRRRAALKLVARNPQPAQEVQANTAALLGDKYTGWVPQGLVIPYVPPPVIGGMVFYGHGFPPDPADTEGAVAGYSWYLDQDTDMLYKLEQ